MLLTFITQIKKIIALSLAPLILTLYPQELVFIVGGNGSGKSTLAKLITGLYIPENGEIMLDEELITEAKPRMVSPAFFGSVFRLLFI